VLPFFKIQNVKNGCHIAESGGPDTLVRSLFGLNNPHCIISFQVVNVVNISKWSGRDWLAIKTGLKFC